ncbi:protein arginine N-methyltransferase 2 [Triplophysa rosa]|uniref:Protein arginine N-methyltransferase 2 n=1 Tax=Triplophysa rosa TaxID=992332 RepID=A0A9W7W8W1_TRIRA|nr:protein arginine N-methyltransferase 2 [Triplophysa rosa]
MLLSLVGHVICCLYFGSSQERFALLKSPIIIIRESGSELQGLFGYVPSSYLHQKNEDEEVEDAWQDEEYFSNYGTLVYAVEASSIVQHTEKLVRQNASVLLALDRWLKEGGRMLPSSAYLTTKNVFWEQPYGLDFKFFSKPKFGHYPLPEDCLSTPSDVITLDMITIQVSDLERLNGEFRFTIEKSGVLHGFTVWFSAHFQSLEGDGPLLELNTGPYSEITHWKQTLFMLDTVIVEKEDVIVGSIRLQRYPIRRCHMSITFPWNINSTEISKVQTKSFPTLGPMNLSLKHSPFSLHLYKQKCTKLESPQILTI